MAKVNLKKLGIQILKFLGFSGIGWLIDFTVYNVLNLFTDNIELHNVISSLCGVTFVFIMSTGKTFAKKQDGISLKWKYVIYVLYQLLLIFAISKLLLFINSQIIVLFAGFYFVKFSAVLSKIIVTPITMTVNFVVMKFLIERI